MSAQEEAAPFVAEVWEATVDSIGRDHTIAEGDALTAEVVAVAARAGAMALAQARADREKPYRDAA